MEEREERRRMQELREQDKRQEEERERMLEKKQVCSPADVSSCVEGPCQEVLRASAAVIFRRRSSSGLKRSRSGGRRRSTWDSKRRSSSRTRESRRTCRRTRSDIRLVLSFRVFLSFCYKPVPHVVFSDPKSAAGLHRVHQGESGPHRPLLLFLGWGITLISVCRRLKWFSWRTWRLISGWGRRTPSPDCRTCCLKARLQVRTFSWINLFLLDFCFFQDTPKK